MAIRVKMLSKGAGQYLKDATLRRELVRRSDAYARLAGPGYLSSGYTGKRARAGVITGTKQAVRDNRRRNTLIRVIGGNRGV